MKIVRIVEERKKGRQQSIASQTKQKQKAVEFDPGRERTHESNGIRNAIKYKRKRGKERETRRK